MGCARSGSGWRRLGKAANPIKSGVCVPASGSGAGTVPGGTSLYGSWSCRDCSWRTAAVREVSFRERRDSSHGAGHRLAFPADGGAGIVRGERPPCERFLSGDAVNPSMEASRKRPCFRDPGKKPLARRPADRPGRALDLALAMAKRAMTRERAGFAPCAGQRASVPSGARACPFGSRSCSVATACTHRVP